MTFRDDQRRRGEQKDARHAQRAAVEGARGKVIDILKHKRSTAERIALDRVSRHREWVDAFYLRISIGRPRGFVAWLINLPWLLMPVGVALIWITFSNRLFGGQNSTDARSRSDHKFVRGAESGPLRMGPPDETCAVCQCDPRNTVHQPICANCGDRFDDKERPCPRPSPGTPYVNCGRGGHMFTFTRKG
jgi:hypothetical protein